jgi:very-short-patch-repair endonuclease
MASPSQSTSSGLEISPTTSGGSLQIDFYCPEARLAIELDSGGHNFANRESLDQERTRFLAS